MNEDRGREVDSVLDQFSKGFTVVLVVFELTPSKIMIQENQVIGRLKAINLKARISKSKLVLDQPLSK